MRGVLLATALLAAFAGATARADGVYVVRSGDTLWEIARDLTGEPEHWIELYRANRDQIKDPSTLYPGQRLAIPDFDAPEAASSSASEASADAGGAGSESP